jgi:3-deoxy-D-manno-octulosonic-acid transferase
LKGLADGVFFAPFDYRSIVRRILRRLRPKVVVIMETEIWPNLFRESKRAGAALIVVNGRISDRALPRYTAWRGFFRHVLALPDAILVQSERDAERYCAAGAPRELVRIAGNLKYDFRPPGAVAAEIDSFLKRAQAETIWIAASTMPPFAPDDPDEDDAVIAAFQEIAPKHPRLLLILVPRRPERFDPAAKKLAAAGISFVRRSALAGDLRLPGVLLLDTIGELAPLFERASMVFMGGTLARRGGHNILEPAYFAKPIILGPHMENFAEIAAEFTAANAVVRIANAGELSGTAERLIDRDTLASTLGAKARELADSKRGVTEEAAAEIEMRASFALPSPKRSLPARLLLTPVSWIWAAGHQINKARGLARQQVLRTRVVSIGGLSMGGVGKSPVVAHLAEKLSEAGSRPAILTRGYKRKSAHGIVIVKRGEKASVDLTGDEAQIFVQRGIADVGIGGDRTEAGRELEKKFKPDIFLLDDGFQHFRLKRDEDIVLIDGADPLGGGVFPLGRLREPFGSLARATAILVTRCDSGIMSGVEKLVRRYNGTSPIFRSRIAPREWVDLEWGTSRPVDAVDARRVAAFCGLGSPAGFWQTLRQLGLEVVYAWPFGDHHRYQPQELQRVSRQAVAAGAEALVTTEKDVMNLCDRAVELVAPLRIYWLKIGVEIENEGELLARVMGSQMQGSAR